MGRTLENRRSERVFSDPLPALSRNLCAPVPGSKAHPAKQERSTPSMSSCAHRVQWTQRSRFNRNPTLSKEWNRQGPSMDQAGAPEQLPKTKEEALEACVEHHAALVACFKTCSLWSAFTGCCVEEHKTFWDCYKETRGTNATKISAWFDNKFGGPEPQGPAPHPSEDSGAAVGPSEPRR